ncbi:MAG: lysophospholipid acyltransferase family protein [Longimicrobiales bacterium]|nr:lysophospholipid acyltransferase family protein [Longimicrobiales bacterium]
MSGLRFEAAGVLGLGLLSALFSTTRVRRTGQAHYLEHRRHGTPVIFAFWHRQLLSLAHYHRNQGIVGLVSEHADGEYLARLMERYGFGTVRGSSTRGGIKGLKGLIREARSGRDLALSPDGPRGPAGVFKPGALAAAQATGHPIIPLAAGVSAGWQLRSWDGFLVPHPFSRVCIEYGRPRAVSRELDRAGIEALARELADELEALTGRAERCAGA